MIRDTVDGDDIGTGNVTETTHNHLVARRGARGSRSSLDLLIRQIIPDDRLVRTSGTVGCKGRGEESDVLCVSQELDTETI